MLKHRCGSAIIALAMSAAWSAFAGLEGVARAESTWLIEVHGRYRSSDDALFPVNFPFSPSMIPAGQDGVFLRTVDPGQMWELSAVNLHYEKTWRHATFFAKLDGIDLDDRNPTSSADAFDIDELWFLIGRDAEPAVVPAEAGAYFKFGKFPRFERQDDRHLQSYGVVATAFNRLEDVGVEVGVDLGRHLYLRASLTQGNPLFMRDTNALAGDNGTPELTVPNPTPEFNSGVVILYDADVHELDFTHPEGSLGVGLRFADSTGDRGVDLLLWRNERQLAETVELDGTFYGGDLDLLLGPGNQFPYAVAGNDKEEVGLNLWLYLGGFSLFAQTVDQQVAGLDRVGAEVELAWRFDLPPAWALGGQQVLPSLAPALRYSRLEPDFGAPPVTPSPSFSWDWEKLDYGLRIGLVGRSDLTVEYSDNTFTLASGRDVEIDEWLATWRLRFGS